MDDIFASLSMLTFFGGEFVEVSFLDGVGILSVSFY